MHGTMSVKEELPRLTKMPYYGTSSSTEKTKMEIIALINKYGISDYQWTSMKGNEHLRFIMQIKRGTIPVNVAVQMDIPDIKAIKGSEVVSVPKNSFIECFTIHLNRY